MQHSLDIILVLTVLKRSSSPNDAAESLPKIGWLNLFLKERRVMRRLAMVRMIISQKQYFL